MFRSHFPVPSASRSMKVYGQRLCVFSISTPLRARSSKNTKYARGDALVVQRDQDGVEQVDRVHDALDAGGFHIVAHLEGLEDDEHDAAGQVGQRALQAEGYRGAGCAEDRHDAGHGHAEDPDDRYHQNNVKCPLDRADQEGPDVRIKSFHTAELRHQFHYFADDGLAHDVDED